MMEKVRNVTKQRVEVCRNCNGLGLINMGDRAKTRSCSICEGSGHVVKTLEIAITITPYAFTGKKLS